MNAERLVSTIWLVFGGAIAYSAFGYGLGAEGEPGTGFLAFFAGIFICLMAVIVYIQSYVNKEMSESTLSKPWEGLNWFKALVVILLTLAFIALIEVVGYFVTSIALLVILMRYIEGLPWKNSIIIPILTVFGTYAVFSSMLDMNMPRGVLGLW